jgi:butyrate kinase
LKILAFISRASSTEIAIYEDMRELMKEAVNHSPQELYLLRNPPEQGQHRFNAIVEALSDDGFQLKDVDMVVTHAESYDLPPGIYMIDESLLELLSANRIEENQYRAGVFAAYLLSRYISSQYDVECIPIVVEPVIINEVLPEASLSGIKGITRDPKCHVLSQRTAVAYFSWMEKGKGTNDVRVVTAHLGNEISVGAYDRGRMIDSNSPQDGEGPFSPSTSGTLPLDALIELCYSGRYDMDEILQIISRRSGLSAYIEDASLVSVIAAYRAGDKKVVFMVNAMAYKVAREIGARSASLAGKPEAIILTGPWTSFDEFVREISSRVTWIAPVSIYTFDSELKSLANTAVEVFKGIYGMLLYGKDRK